MNTKTKLVLTALTASAVLVFTPYTVKAQEANWPTTDNKGQEAMETVAIDGFCPVCIFGGKKIKGSDHFVTEYKGKIYKFVDIAKQKEFLEDPEKYVVDLDAKYKALQ